MGGLQLRPTVNPPINVLGAKLFPRPRAKYLHTFGRRSTGEILYAFGRRRRSTRESIYVRAKGI